VIPREQRPASLYRVALQNSKAIEWPCNFSLDPRLGFNLADIPMQQSEEKAGAEIIKLSNVVVLPGGIILEGRKIHPASSLYERLSPEIVFRASSDYYSVFSRAEISSACLVSRQLIDHGTYGDYLIEFALPMAWAAPELSGTLLVDAEFVARNIQADMAGWPQLIPTPIPPGGIKVASLSVVCPCQPFDHFSSENLMRLAKAFHVSAASEQLDRVYLSRVGFADQRSAKQTRVIKNEEEIERFLASVGFHVLRPDGTNNAIVRSKIASARVIIYSHGSGVFQAVWGKPRAVLELASERWWNPAFLRLAYGMGAKRFHVLCTEMDCISLDELAEILNSEGWSASPESC